MKKIIPRYKKCFICGKDNPKGLNLYFYHEKGELYCDFTGKPENVGYGDRVHGGILASIVDEAMGWAPYIITGKMYYTWEMTIRYLHPVPIGKPVQIIAKMTEDKKRYVLCEGKITDREEKIYIKSTGKYAPMTEENQKEVFTYLE